ncbi:MAG: hypothetical protein AAFZ63_21565 [Bacteroidota bacterium]
MANSVSEFEELILDELDVIQDPGTIRTIYDLIEHADKEEEDKKKADPPNMRPRPDGKVNAAHFRKKLKFELIPSETLQQHIKALLEYLEALENLIENA